MNSAAGVQSESNQTALAVLIAADALLFALGAVAHLGLSIPWEETRIIGASIVEGIGALLLVTALTGVWTGRRWGRRISWLALGFSFVGILVGMVALVGGAAVRTASNDYLHIGMVLVTTLALTTLALVARARS